MILSVSMVLTVGAVAYSGLWGVHWVLHVSLACCTCHVQLLRVIFVGGEFGHVIHVYLCLRVLIVGVVTR